MPQAGQIIPDHLYPHNKVVVHDNTEYKTILPEEADDSNKMLFVFASPKGIDNKIRTIEGGQKEFVDKYGIGPFSLYGQPYLNAYAALGTGNIVAHCLRVSAPNANYSYVSIDLLYKVDETGNMVIKFKKNTEGGILTDLEDISYENWTPDGGATPPVPPGPGVDAEEISREEIDEVLALMGKSKSESFARTMALEEGTDTETDTETPDGGDSGTTDTPTTPTTDEGYTRIPFMTVACIGKGVYGRKLRFTFSNNAGSDKENDFKNYILCIYEDEGTLTLKDQFAVCLSEYAIVNGRSLFIDGVVNDPDTGSDWVQVVSNSRALEEVFKAYKDANPDTEFTVDDFDPILGINKHVRNGAIPNLVIDTMSEDIIALNSITGIPLEGGSDGDFDETVDPATREAALDAAYLRAFNKEIDPSIGSKNRFPTHLMLDANYKPNIKQALSAMCDKRGDCAYVLDCGTGIKTKRAPLTYAMNNLDDFVTNRNAQVDAICGKIRDPYSKKIVTVTGTYLLAMAYPNSWALNGGKHVPVAGNQFGVIDGFIKNSIYPVYDEDLDSDVMDELCEARINFARINSRQKIVRATQTTRQTITSNLSEANNVMILLDIKRDCELLCDLYQYNFSEMSDIARFNKDAESVLYDYRNQQVRKIEASFDKNDWEAERGILHLYVEMEHKDLVKTSIIEIDVNRGSTSTEE